MKIILASVERPKMTAHKIELRIESPSGGKVLGYVVIGISESRFLDLKNKFPDEGFKGQNPKVNEAIKEGITEDEKRQIAQHLGIWSNANFKFEFQTITRYVDEAKQHATFESNGKKFWVFLHHRY